MELEIETVSKSSLVFKHSPDGATLIACVSQDLRGQGSGCAYIVVPFSDETISAEPFSATDMPYFDEGECIASLPIVVTD